MTSLPFQAETGGAVQQPVKQAPQGPMQGAPSLPAQRQPTVDQRALDDMIFDEQRVRQSAMSLQGSRQVAPFGSAEAAEAGIQKGWYPGLESLDFGSTGDGNFAVRWRNQDGTMGVRTLTPDQYFGALSHRAAARVEMARQIRRDQDARRLAPSMAPMVGELDQMIPGFGVYADMSLQEDPRRAYEDISSLYMKVKAGDREAADRAMKVTGDAMLRVAQDRASTWAKQSADSLAESARGFIEDDGVPEEVRAARVQDIKRQQRAIEQFALLAPPTGRAAQSASFPTWYLSQGQPGPVRELVETAIRDIGQGNLSAVGEEQALPFVVQKAQDLAYRIGWMKPFGPGDIDMVTSAAKQAMMARIGGMGQQPLADAASMGTAAGIRQEQDARGMKRREQELKQQQLQGQIQADAVRTEATAAKGDADLAGQVIKRMEPRIRKRLEDAGIPVGEHGVLKAMEHAYASLRASKDPKAKEKMAVIQEIDSMLRMLSE